MGSTKCDCCNDFGHAAYRYNWFNGLTPSARNAPRQSWSMGTRRRDRTWHRRDFLRGPHCRPFCSYSSMQIWSSTNSARREGRWPLWTITRRGSPVQRQQRIGRQLRPSWRGHSNGRGGVEQRSKAKRRCWCTSREIDVESTGHQYW